MLILGMLFFNQLFDATLYTTEPTVELIGLELVSYIYTQYGKNSFEFNSSVDFYVDYNMNIDDKIVELRSPSKNITIDD